jgi:SAM-dependent methyltransferase
MMIAAEIIWGLLAVNQLADAVRNRRRLQTLPRLVDSDTAMPDGFRVVTAPNVVLSEATCRAAAAHMTQHGLRALDLVPGVASLSTAWSLSCYIDNVADRKDICTAGSTGAHAFLVEEALLSAQDAAQARIDLGTFVVQARELKRRCGGAHDLAIAPDLVGVQPNPFFDVAAEQARFGGGMGPVTVGMPLMWAIVALGLVFAPVMGLVVFGLLHLQQLFALSGGPISVPGLAWRWLLRIPVDLLAWSRLIRGRLGLAAKDDADRAIYADLIDDGLGAFFSPVSVQCPLCDSEALTPFLTTGDVHMGKPGRFSLSRCGGCAHIFQNPQLNPKGLDYYYRDAYDGRNAVGMDMLFGSYVKPYLDRIEMVASAASPEVWLDVGCGHGHLCAHGRSRLPKTRFEGLDMGESVDIALARGWLDAAHRGLFPDLAPAMVESYDVVSMSHYLEHTLDPRLELAAAHRVLRKDGHLLIELPDPDSPWAKWLGANWMPWFQPQHLHLLSCVNLARLLREAGFEPVRWETGAAHQSTDLFLAAVVFLRRLSPPLGLPWLKPPRLWERTRSLVVWGPGLALVFAATVADRCLTPFGRRLRHSSAFRVLARRVADQPNMGVVSAE